MSTIEWTETTWNPVTGCDHCYALTMARRLKGMGQAKYQRDGNPATSGPGFGVTVHEDALTAPLRWKTPRTVFVNSMSDLFHPDVPDEFIARVFAVMALTPQHTYQVLTKRHGRMRALLNRRDFAHQVAEQGRKGFTGCQEDWPGLQRRPAGAMLGGPLPNVWLGVSAEDQKRAELRIPALMKTPAALRFVSAEPLIGPLDLSPWFQHAQIPACARCAHRGPVDIESGHVWGACSCDCHPPGPPRPDWVIIGGESGPGAREMREEWAVDVAAQCRRARVPVFVKQMGSAWARLGGEAGKGNDPTAWPDELSGHRAAGLRQMPAVGAPVGGGGPC